MVDRRELTVGLSFAAFALDDPLDSGQSNVMNVEQLRRRMHENERPFVLRLSDGRRFRVPHQDFIAIGKHAVVVIDSEGYAVNIDPLHIVSFDDTRAKGGKK